MGIFKVLLLVSVVGVSHAEFAEYKKWNGFGQERLQFPTNERLFPSYKIISKGTEQILEATNSGTSAIFFKVASPNKIIFQMEDGQFYFAGIKYDTGAKIEIILRRIGEDNLTFKKIGANAYKPPTDDQLKDANDNAFFKQILTNEQILSLKETGFCTGKFEWIEDFLDMKPEKVRSAYYYEYFRSKPVILDEDKLEQLENLRMQYQREFQQKAACKLNGVHKAKTV